MPYFAMYAFVYLHYRSCCTNTLSHSQQKHKLHTWGVMRGGGNGRGGGGISGETDESVGECTCYERETEREGGRERADTFFFFFFLRNREFVCVW